MASSTSAGVPWSMPTLCLRQRENHFSRAFPSWESTTLWCAGKVIISPLPWKINPAICTPLTGCPSEICCVIPGSRPLSPTAASWAPRKRFIVGFPCWLPLLWRSVPQCRRRGTAALWGYSGFCWLRYRSHNQGTAIYTRWGVRFFYEVIPNLLKC